MGKRLDSNRIALFGSGAQAQRWACALARYAQLDSGSFEDAAGVVIAPGAEKPHAIAVDAASAGIPVLWACCEPLLLLGESSCMSSGQVSLVRLADPKEGDDALKLLRRLLGGAEPFWEPVYIRLNTCAANGLEEAAIGALALVQGLLGNQAQSVAAHRAHGATFLTVQFKGGALAQLTVADADQRTLEIVTRECSLKLEGDRLHLFSRGMNGVGRDRYLNAGRRDPIEQEAAEFVTTISRGTFKGNLDKWIAGANVWQAARQSMVGAGPVWLGSPGLVQVRAKVPTSIVEGGLRVARRRLALVS